MKAFVTGGVGFLGSSLVQQLLAIDAEIFCLVRTKIQGEHLARLAQNISKGRLHLVIGTVEKPESYQKTLENCDVLYHLASASRGGTSVLFLNNVVGMRQLVSAVLASKIKRFVLVSSLGVYGPHQLKKNSTLDETCPVDANPQWRDPYTYSKAAQEKVAWEAFHQKHLPLVVVRPGVIYGPGRDCITGRVGLKVGSFLLQMGGKQKLPYTYVDNCAEAILLAGTAPSNVHGEIINVIDDGLVSGNELVSKYRRELKGLFVVRVPAPLIIPLSKCVTWYSRYSQGQIPAVLSPYKSTAMWKSLNYSNSKAKRLLSWQPRVSMSEGIQKTLTALAA